MISSFAGMQLVECKSMVDRVQARKHHRKRINKKYRKQYGFIEVPKSDVLVMGTKIVGHPTVIAKIKN